MRTRTTIWSCLSFLLLSFPALYGILPSSVNGAIPGADNAKAYTDAIYAEESLAFNRATLGEAYKTAGKHNPTWDAQVLTYLERTAVAFSYANMQLRPKSVPSLKQLSDEGQALIAMGCDDPLVIYGHASNLNDSRTQFAVRVYSVQSAH